MPKLRNNISMCSNGSGLALLDEARGEYWHLNSVGREMLDELLADISVEEVVARLATRYDAEPAQIRHDVDKLIAELQAAHLLNT